MIRKTSETRALAGNITSSYNDSQTSAYSTEYINQAFGGILLWTNPNPGSSFNSKNINIDSSYSDCNYYEILFKAAYNSNLYYNTGKIEIDKQGCLLGQVGGGMYYRECGTISSGVMLIANAYPIGSSTGNNGALIPYKIIGYK